MGSWIHKFAKELFLQCGTRIFVLTADKGEDGNINIAR